MLSCLHVIYAGHILHFELKQKNNCGKMEYVISVTFKLPRVISIWNIAQAHYTHSSLSLSLSFKHTKEHTE